MLLLITDLETTGINHNQDKVIELGAIQYSVKYGTIIKSFSTLLANEISNAQSINKIDPLASLLSDDDLSCFVKMQNESDYVVGHNFKRFDINFFGKNGLPDITKPIIDTQHDVRFPMASKKSKKLTDIAIDHGVPVWKPHRALYDCKLIADIFDSYNANELASMIDIALEPKSLYISLEQKPGSLSKEEGFKWNDDVKGRWSKYLRTSEVGSLPFDVVPCA